MKPHLMIRWLARSAAVLLAAAAPAAIYDQTFTSGFANNGMIPDHDPAGWQNSQTVDVGGGWTVTDVGVRLNISGGWNGDLYGYLRYEAAGGGQERLFILLDRVGYSGTGNGYNDPGLAISLSDVGGFGLENYQAHDPVYNSSGQLTGTWRPDNGTTRFGGPGGVFTGVDPNGTWTLFFADLAPGDQSQLMSWGLEISAVPEPTVWALAIFGIGAGGVVGVRTWRRRRRGISGTHRTVTPS
jgi:hypothetical protein